MLAIFRAIASLDKKDQTLMKQGFLYNVFAKAAACAGVYGLAPEPSLLRHAVYELASPKWPSTHASLNIAMAADWHVGSPSVTLKKVEELVERLNALRADIILLPGDFQVSNEYLSRYVSAQSIAERLGKLKAKYGVYGVLGNHDWHEDGLKMHQELELHGITMLENGAVKVVRPDKPGQDIWIAGLADDTTRTPDLKAAYNHVTTQDPIVMMCHDPGTFQDIDERPVVTVCGHTHGGQVMFPGRRYLQSLPSRAPWEHVYGHKVENNRDLIVTSGIGTSSLPIRFNCPAEIVSIRLGPSI